MIKMINIFKEREEKKNLLEIKNCDSKVKTDKV